MNEIRMNEKLYRKYDRIGYQAILLALAYAALVVAVSVYWLRFPVERGLIVTVLTCAVCIGLATGGADMVLKVSKILKQRCRN